MPRYAFRVEYDGSSFCGWQKQEQAPRIIPTVQATLEQAFAALTQEVVVFQGAGRTDKGVHATGQVAHTTTTRSYAMQMLHHGLNFHLKKHPVTVHEVWPVADDFHARFSAVWRRYRYHVCMSPGPPVLRHAYTWWVSHSVNVPLLTEAAHSLLGHHDFSAFRSSECQSASPWKTMTHLQVTRDTANELHLDFQAPSFLQQQVRRMVGALMQVGRQVWTLDDFHAFKRGHKTKIASVTAPPQGLVLLDVGYAPCNNSTGDIHL